MSSLRRKLGRKATEDDLFSSLMYPKVFDDFQDFRNKYGDVSVLPTTAYFHGLEPGEEISVDIEEGKTLFVKLLHVGDPDEKGIRSLTFELNGKARTTMVQDRSVKGRPRRGKKPTLPIRCRPVRRFPPWSAALPPVWASPFSKGEKVAVLEAMKMQTTLYASADGTVDDILVQVGDSVESKDLIARLR